MSYVHLYIWLSLRHFMRGILGEELALEPREANRRRGHQLENGSSAR